MDEEKFLFNAKSPLGYNVVLSEDRYYNHIISSDGGHNPHPEFTPGEIKKGIENPCIIYSGKEPDTDVYFAKSVQSYPSLFLKVAVATYPEIGDVKTAFLSKHISGGIQEGGIKYVSFNNEL